MTRQNDTHTDDFPSKNPSQPLSGWWFVLMALPFGFVFQLAGTTTFNRLINEANLLCVLIIDAFILVRIVVGLLYQPRSRDWRWYLAFIPISVPLLWILH